MEKICGIYTITNKINNKIYVGQSINCVKRLRNHKRKLCDNKHDNIFVQRAVNKYGIENFEFEVLVECKEYLLCSEEHYWCVILNTHNDKYGYNLNKTNPENRKNRHSQETKEKISSKNKGRTISIERRNHLSIINTGKKQSKELIEKRKASYKKTVEERGYYHTQETIDRIREKQKGKERAKGRKISEETKNKIGKAHKGKEIPQEMRERISKTLSRSILQYDLNGNFIREWESVKQASKTLKINNQTICIALRNINKTSGGFRWRLKNDKSIEQKLEIKREGLPKGIYIKRKKFMSYYYEKGIQYNIGSSVTLGEAVDKRNIWILNNPNIVNKDIIEKYAEENNLWDMSVENYKNKGIVQVPNFELIEN